MKYLIYKYTSPSNKNYIGQTKNLTKREKQHQSIKSKCTAFSSAIKKYGFDNFTLEILEQNLTLEEANIREPYWILFYNTLAPNGYNLMSGGNNSKHSEERIKIMIEQNLGENNPMYGKKHTIEASQKMKANHINNSGENHPMFGKHHSEESIERRKILIKGENNPMYGKFGENNPNSKKYIITFPDGHEEVIIGLNQFCKDNKLRASNMCNVAKGRAKSHKGFKCRYFIECIDIQPNTC
jgi:group I intron endonuclease